MLLCHSDRRSLRHLPYPGRRLGHLRQWRPIFVVGTCPGSSAPSLWGIWNGSLCGGTAVTGRAAVTGGPQLLVGLPLLAGRRYWRGHRYRWGCCSHWRVWWGIMGPSGGGIPARRGHRPSAPAELSPNGNRCPLRSIPCRPQGPPICTQSPARIVPPYTGDTRADRYS